MPHLPKAHFLNSLSFSKAAAPPSTNSWDIVFVDTTADFGADSTNELVTNYDIGKDLPFEALLLKDDCITATTGIAFTQEVNRVAKNSNYDTLTLSYNIDKSTIGGSNIWDQTASKIKFCQVVRLVNQGVVIVENKRGITIDFALGGNFVIENQALAVASETIVDNVNQNIDGYLAVYKCNTDNMDQNTAPLSPNEYLHVCFKSTAPNDVGVEFIDEVVSLLPIHTLLPVLYILNRYCCSVLLYYTNSNHLCQDIKQLTTTLEAVNARTPNAFTSIQVVSATEQRVSTRVPVSLFSYSQGSTITITGSYTMKLVGSRRVLKTVPFVDEVEDMGSKVVARPNFDNSNSKNNFDDFDDKGEEVASFELNVALVAPTLKSPINKKISSTASSLLSIKTSSVITGLAIVFASVAMW